MIRFLTATSLFALAAPAFAQEASPPPSEAQAESPDHHDEAVVTGVRRSVRDTLGGVSVLSGAALAAEVKPSLGETLAGQPGVSATSFGPAASRPVLRGNGGERVRILTDGIGVLDVSSSSQDHPVAINPLTADRIEVLRGPAALEFGSAAIGGVVNVIDNRIPRRAAERPLHVALDATYGSAADERSLSGVADIPLVAKLVAHVDASWSKSDDMRTGGHILADELRDAARASADPSIRALADLKGELPNSAQRRDEVGLGLGWVDGPMNAGLSYTRGNSFYGVPIRYSLDPAAEAEAPRIDARSHRWDGRVELPLDGAFSEIKLRGGIGRYRHDELEPEGDIGSTFRARGGEGRADLVQRDRDGWGGTTGLQYLEKAISVRGEEKYLPDSRATSWGAYTLQWLSRDDWRVEGGLRLERGTVAADADTDLGTPDQRRRFTALSWSVGGLYDIAPDWRAGLNLTLASRIPSIDELYANGPHAGSQAFEIGRADLDVERSVGAEASLKYLGKGWNGQLTVYAARFSNFIYQFDTGDIEDGLPVLVYNQGRARQHGIELEVEANLGRMAGIDWRGRVAGDAVRITISGFGPAPLVPPARLFAGLDGRAGAWSGGIEIEHDFAQRRTAPNETDTDGFTLVGAKLDWRPLAARPGLTLGVAVENLFDVEARRHASLLKDYAPLAGRDVRLTARFDF